MIRFYSHKNGDYRHFSNFYPSPIKENGKNYETVEHYYQAAKATNAEDHDFIRKADSPKESKVRGQKVKLRQDWDSVKYNVMKQALWLKFSQNKELGELLLSTGDEEIHEETQNDKIWGWWKGTGKDLLGKALMETRTKLRR